MRIHKKLLFILLSASNFLGSLTLQAMDGERRKSIIDEVCMEWAAISPRGFKSCTDAEEDGVSDVLPQSSNCFNTVPREAEEEEDYSPPLKSARQNFGAGARPLSKQLMVIPTVIESINHGAGEVAHVLTDINTTLAQPEQSQGKQGADISTAVIGHGTNIAEGILDKVGEGDIGDHVQNTGDQVIIAINDAQAIIEEDHQYNSSCAPGWKQFLRVLRGARKGVVRIFVSSAAITEDFAPDSQASDVLSTLSEVGQVLDPALDGVVDVVDEEVSGAPSKAKPKKPTKAKNPGNTPPVVGKVSKGKEKLTPIKVKEKEKDSISKGKEKKESVKKEKGGVKKTAEKRKK